MMKSRLHSLQPRTMLRSMVAGSMLMPGILSELLAADAVPVELDPLSPQPSHFAGRAKRVIFLHMSGGVSHVDTFDPKPRLTPIMANR